MRRALAPVPGPNLPVDHAAAMAAHAPRASSVARRLGITPRVQAS
jgi:hypothetical protein